MGLKTYFFDTYALFEIILGNPGYSRFRERVSIIITRLNLMELYYGFLLRCGTAAAGRYYDRLLEYAVDIDDDTIKKAALFRTKNKKMSYADCIGYVISLQRNILFLTGDEHFRKLPNVEFVK